MTLATKTADNRRLITNRLAREIRQAREQGMTYKSIAETFDVSYSTAMRYGDDKNRINQLHNERKRHGRMMSGDPVYAAALEKKRASARAYARKLREETNAGR